NIYVQNYTYKLTVQRFSDVMWAMQQVLFTSFDKRLAIFLLDELESSSTDEVKLTHEQIAKYMGSAREVVSRMLKYFENDGIVKIYRGGVKIIDKEKLRQQAQ
ncbi:MAG: helix-turn-helix domain-containing protein, partial [Oscillospiraceae bacterium]